MHGWNEYRISLPGEKSHGVDGTPFEHVCHISHVKETRRILEDGFIRASLVNDSGPLDSSRTCVNFLSANTWAEGSIYGNVSWHFDWKSLIQGRNIYWVEARKNYQYPIYRFLCSELPQSAFPSFLPYDPRSDLGPLREKDGNWYFNGTTAVSEFLIDGDLALEDCVELDFVNHHPTYCRTNGCSEKGKRDRHAQAEVIAFLLGNGIHSLDQILRKPARWRTDNRLSDCVPDGLSQLFNQLSCFGATSFSGALKEDENILTLVRGAMALYSYGQLECARRLVSLLEDRESLLRVITRAVEEHFGIDDYEIFHQ